MKEADNFDFIDMILRFFRSFGVQIKKATPEQLALIVKDKEAFMERCWNIYKKHDEREERYRESHDGKCPKCGSLKADIVNKIRQVQGSGEGHVSGNLFGISGSSSMSIDTNGVNHCNKCGNEWIKYKKEEKYRSDVIYEALNYTANLVKDPEEYKWAKDLGRPFDGCYIETILEVLDETSSYDIYASTKENLTFSNLYPYFKSVMDDPEIKRELKILY